MNKLWTAFLLALLASCSSSESAQFAPPRFVSVESEVTGRNAVTLHCTLSDERVESCGFLYGADGKLDRRVECELSGLSFEASISGITDDVDYTWCAFVAAGGVEIKSSVGMFRTSPKDPVPVEDPAFLSYLVGSHDYDGDGVFSYSDALRVTRICLSPTNKYNLQSLQGIEYMPDLEEIDCQGEWYDVPDKSKNPDREYYYIGNYRNNWAYWGSIGTLRYVDVTNNPKLVSLYLCHNSALGEELGTIDLKHNPLLKNLDLGMTWLFYPDISSNVNLEFVQLTHLRGALPDFSKLTKVTGLFIEWPQDAAAEQVDLDVSNMPRLESLAVAGRVRSLSDLSLNPKLKWLYMSSCRQFAQGLDFSGNPELETLYCENTNQTSLDLSALPKLQSFDCSPMTGNDGRNMLKTVYVAHGQQIPGVTVNRSSEFIPDETQIEEYSVYPPDDELWYTTVSGKPISIKSGFCPGLRLVSNTYEDGLGVLKFSGPISTFAEWALWENSDVESLTVPSSVKATTYSCFRENMNMKRVVFAPGLIILGDSSLHHNEGLEEVILPDTVVSIEKDALSHAYSLESIDLPPYLESLGQSAFLHCGALKSIVLPATMKSIGIYAFEHDVSLKSLTCLAPIPPAGGTEMFDDTAECPIYVPAASVAAYKSAPYWSNYAHRIRGIVD